MKCGIKDPLVTHYNKSGQLGNSTSDISNSISTVFAVKSFKVDDEHLHREAVERHDCTHEIGHNGACSFSALSGLCAKPGEKVIAKHTGPFDCIPYCILKPEHGGEHEYKCFCIWMW